MRTKTEQDWNDYLVGEVRKGYEHMPAGRGMTNDQLKKYLADNKVS